MGRKRRRRRRGQSVCPIESGRAPATTAGAAQQQLAQAASTTGAAVAADDQDGWGQRGRRGGGERGTPAAAAEACHELSKVLGGVRRVRAIQIALRMIRSNCHSLPTTMWSSRRCLSFQLRRQAAWDAAPHSRARKRDLGRALPDQKTRPALGPLGQRRPGKNAAWAESQTSGEASSHSKKEKGHIGPRRDGSGATKED